MRSGQWRPSLRRTVHTTQADRVDTTQLLHDDPPPSRFFWRDGRLRTAARGFAIAVAAVAGSILVGWFAHIPRLVQLNDHVIAVHFNTALCFLALAGALFALTGRRYRI